MTQRYAILFQSGKYLCNQHGERQTFAQYAYAFNVAQGYRHLGARVIEL
jgi:hypothetical protein